MISFCEMMAQARYEVEILEGGKNICPVVTFFFYQVLPRMKCQLSSKFCSRCAQRDPLECRWMGRQEMDSCNAWFQYAPVSVRYFKIKWKDSWTKMTVCPSQSDFNENSYCSIKNNLKSTSPMLSLISPALNITGSQNSIKICDKIIQLHHPDAERMFIFNALFQSYSPKYSKIYCLITVPSSQRNNEPTET